MEDKKSEEQPMVDINKPESPIQAPTILISAVDKHIEGTHIIRSQKPICQHAQAGGPKRCQGSH